ncbi:MAG: proteinsorting protein, partial [Verrucomicrobiaceae bacterium]|nr:proteinsorting protein [Verrucomicrobiaceae bacterium]
NLSNTASTGVAASGSKSLLLAGTNTGANIFAPLYVDNTGGNSALTKSGTGTWVLTNANTHTGATTVSNGVLRLGNASAVQNSTMTVSNNNSLGFSSGITNFTFGNLSGTGDLALADVAAGAVNLTIGGNNASPAAYSGSLSGPGNIAKVGTGALVLSGSNSNSGTVTVNGGTLSVSGSTLASVTGISVGSVTSSTLDLYADGVGVTTNLASNTSIILGGAGSSGRLGFHLGTSSDQLVLSGTGTLSIDAGGGFLDGSALSGFGAGSYTLISGAASIAGTPALGSLPGGFGYSLTTGATSVILNVTAATGTDFYWAGDVNGSWTGFGSGGADTNWSTSALATTPDAGATPGTGQIVNFSASTGASNFSTTLDNAFSVAGLKFLNAGSAVTIAAGTSGTLQVGASGIEVQTGAPAPTISAPLIIGTTQTWNVADAATVLNITGAVSGGQPSSTQASPGLNNSFTVTGLGAGSLGSTLNTFTGDILVDGGGFIVDNDRDWGGVTVASTTSKTITLTNGGRLIVNANLNPGATTTTSYNLIQVGSGGGTINTASGVTLTLDDAGQLYGSGALTKTGVGTLLLRNQGAFAGTIDITAGTILSSAGGTSSMFGLSTVGTSIQSGAAFNLNGLALTEVETLIIYGAGLASAAAGVITNSSGTAASFAGPIALGADSTIGAAAAGGITLSGSFSGAFNLTINNRAAGGTTLSGTTINNGGAISNVGAGAGATVISGNIGNAVTGVVQNSPASSLTLSGTNSFGGGVMLTQGTLNINSPSALGSGLFTISAGTTINNSSAGAVVTTTNPTQTWDGNFSFTGTQSLDLGIGAVSLGTSAGTDRTVTTTAGILTVGGVISDGTTATGIVKAGAGTLVLGGANTYSGVNTISAGILSISSAGNLGNNSVTNTISIAGGALRNTGTSVTLGTNRSVTLGAGGGTIDVTGTNSLNVNGVVTGGNPLTKTGTGTLVLSNTGNTINSTVNVNGGTLSVHPSALMSSTGIFVGQTTAGTLDLYADGAATTTTLTGTSITLGGASTSGRLGFQLGASGTSDQIALSGGALTVAAGGGLINGTALSGFGAGTWTLVTGAAITGTPALGALPGGFAYTLTTGASTITLTATAATGTNYYWAGDVNASWTGFAAGGGTNTNWSTSATAITPDAGATPGAGQTVNFSVTTGAANFSTTLDNAFSVAGINFLAAGSAVTIAPGSGGTLQLGTGGISVATTAPAPTISAPIILGANNTWTVTDAATTLTVANDVSETGGARTLTKAGAGSLFLGGANSYTGLTTVSGGVLTIQTSTGLGTTAAGTSVASGAALQLQGGITVGAEALTLVGSGISSGGALRNLSGNNSWAGAITMTTPGARINSDSGTLTIDVASGNAVAGTGFALTLGGAGNGAILDPIATGTSGTLIK